MPKCEHADLIMQYAKDCQEHEKPWLLWSMQDKYTGAITHLDQHPFWDSTAFDYVRKPKRYIVNGVEVMPGMTEVPEIGSSYYVPRVGGNYYAVSLRGNGSELSYVNTWRGEQIDLARLRRGVAFKTMEGADAMALAMLAFKTI